MSCPAHRQQEAEAAQEALAAVYTPTPTIVHAKRWYKRTIPLPQRILVDLPPCEMMPVTLANGDVVMLPLATFNRLYELVF